MHSMLWVDFLGFVFFFLLVKLHTWCVQENRNFINFKFHGYNKQTKKSKGEHLHKLTNKKMVVIVLHNVGYGVLSVASEIGFQKVLTTFVDPSHRVSSNSVRRTWRSQLVPILP